MGELAGARLNPVTLCFQDPKLEHAYRRQYALVAQRQLRRFLVFVCVLSVVLSELIAYRIGRAEAAGLQEFFHIGGPSRMSIAAAIALTVMLFGATFSRRLLPHLQSVTFGCFGGLLLLDQANVLTLPLPYSLTWALVNLTILYTALQLRFFAACALGIGISVIHLAALMTVHNIWRADIDLQLQFGVNVTLVVGFNLMLMFINHQRELHARMAYLQTALAAERSASLEEALDSLKRAEGQLIETEKQATVGRLVAGILHETNTPIGALSSATHTLKLTLNKLADQRPHDAAQTIAVSKQLLDVQAASAARLGELVSSLRQFVSLDQQGQRVTDIRKGLRTACALLTPELPEGVAFSLDLPADPVWVRCFPERLNQTFLSLFQNSVSAFVPQSSGHQSIDCQVRAHGAHVRITLTDTGRGMSAEQLANVFEVGFSHRGARVKLHLGLPTSKKNIEDVGGTLTISSTPNIGTTAEIRLPLSPSEPETAQLELQPKLSTAAP